MTEGSHHPDDPAGPMPATVPTFIDTSVWINALRPNGTQDARDTVRDCMETGLSLTNGLVKAELLKGARTQKDFDRISEMLAGLLYVEATREVWDLAGELSFSVRRHGETVPTADLFVAASALSQDALLVHSDRHFDAVEKVTDLWVRFIE